MNLPKKNQIYLQDEGNNSSCHRRWSWSARVRRGAPRFLFLTHYWWYLSNVGEISVRYWCESSEMLLISRFWINHPFRFVVIKFKYKYSASTNTTSMIIQTNLPCRSVVITFLSPALKEFCYRKNEKKDKGDLRRLRLVFVMLGQSRLCDQKYLIDFSCVFCDFPVFPVFFFYDFSCVFGVFPLIFAVLVIWASRLCDSQIKCLSSWAASPPRLLHYSSFPFDTSLKIFNLWFLWT